MATEDQLKESKNEPQQSMPYVTVGKDARGSAVWLVVSNDMILECVSGSCAITIMQNILASKGSLGPTCCLGLMSH